MDPKTKARLEARAEIIKALGHPTRLLVVEQLSQGERCVCELHELPDCDLSTLSKHLSILKSAGIVETERRGTMIFYRLAVPCILNFFGCVEAVLKHSAACCAEVVS